MGLLHDAKRLGLKAANILKAIEASKKLPITPGYGIKTMSLAGAGTNVAMDPRVFPRETLKWIRYGKLRYEWEPGNDYVILTPVLNGDDDRITGEGDIYCYIYGNTTDPLVPVRFDAEVDDILPFVWLERYGDPKRGVLVNPPIRVLGDIFAVSVTKDGGDDGDNSNAATYTYTVEDLDENELGTAMSPVWARPVGSMTPATHGTGYYDANGDFVLYQVDEVPQTTECE